MKVFKSDEMVAVISKDDARELDLFMDCFRSALMWDETEQQDYLFIHERDRDKWLSILERIKNQLK